MGIIIVSSIYGFDYKFSIKYYVISMYYKIIYLFYLLYIQSFAIIGSCIVNSIWCLYSFEIMERKDATRDLMKIHYPIEISEYSSHETDSLIEMPLPSYSHDSENSARTQIYPLDRLRRPQLSRSLVSSFIENSLDSSTVLNNNSNWPQKTFCKQRNGGKNIVNEIRKNPGNSYLARKNNYIERMKKRYTLTINPSLLQ